jgi:hypothetical protein
MAHHVFQNTSHVGAIERLWQLIALLAVGVRVCASAAERTVRGVTVGINGPASYRTPVYSPACIKYGVMLCDDAAISGRTVLANLSRYDYLRMPQMARAACKFVWLAVVELLSPSWPLSRHELSTQPLLLLYMCVCLCGNEAR